MKAIIDILTVISILSLSPLGFADERTGWIIRDLINSIENSIEMLEAKSEGIQKSREGLQKGLDANWKEIQRESDPLRKEKLRAEIHRILAQMNELDLKEVWISLQTISEVLPKTEQLKDELKNAIGMHTAEEEFKEYRIKVGSAMTNAANILQQLKSSTLSRAAKAEISSLESILVGALNAWELPQINYEGGIDPMDKTIRDIQNANSQLINLNRVLNIEKVALKLANYKELVRLAVIRMNHGKINSEPFQDQTQGVYRRIKSRGKVFTQLNQQKSSLYPNRYGHNNSDNLPPETANDLERIRRGQFRWNKNK